ncbi:C4-dicarboxylate TRAP transporter substrate-binding protein [Salipiger sp.]|uniref:C4-dicarboxylate TRAP transporter substrate-binding protein n=1 Tax=Salipiger sp. TaxID=2078585 RepID=UPI003A979B2E
MKLWRAALVSGAVAAATAGGAMAENYRASTWIPATDNHSKFGLTWFTDEVRDKTNGEIDFEVFYGGALLPAKSTLQGVADGVAQLGFVTSGYIPSELPVANAVSGMSFVEGDPIVMGMAFADFYMHEPQYNDFAHNGTVALGAFGNAPTTFHCRSEEPPTSLADLQGKRVRFPGGLIAKFASDLGMIPVAIPAPEMYQALQTGQVDCVSIYPTWLNIDNSLAEVSKSTLLINIVPGFNSPAQVLDADFWRSLTTEQRKIMLDASARSMAKMEIGYLTQQDQAIEMAKADGHNFGVPDQTLLDAINAWVADGVGGQADIARETHHIEDPELLFATFQKYIDKWKPLVEGMTERYNEDELTALIKTNLTDTVDPATYGME